MYMARALYHTERYSEVSLSLTTVLRSRTFVQVNSIPKIYLISNYLYFSIMKELSSLLQKRRGFRLETSVGGEKDYCSHMICHADPTCMRVKWLQQPWRVAPCRPRLLRLSRLLYATGPSVRQTTETSAFHQIDTSLHILHSPKSPNSLMT